MNIDLLTTSMNAVIVETPRLSVIKETKWNATMQGWTIVQRVVAITMPLNPALSDGMMPLWGQPAHGETRRQRRPSDRAFADGLADPNTWTP